MASSESAPVSRRTALKVLGAATASVTLGLTRSGAAEPVALGWDLPPLGFDYAAREPHLDAKTMEIHHAKHHQAYLTNARNLLKEHPELLARGPEALVRDLDSLPAGLRAGLINNVGGHVNHAFFWKLLAPDQGASIQQLPVAIAGAFGSMEQFKQQFADAAMRRFGSGWAWLSAKPDGTLLIHSTANQDSPLSAGLVPIIGLDVWEHAYYLRYQNRRADYVTAFWSVLNWTQAEVNFSAARRG